MKTKKDKSTLTSPQDDLKGKNDLEGYPAYPANEDIYSKYKEEKDLNPEDISKTKGSNDTVGTSNEKDFTDDVSGSDLDIPGNDLDDNPERFEDEENDYYSLGGDDHNDLEEDTRD
jgi:hypothetical protein